MLSWLFDTPLGQMLAREEDGVLLALDFVREGDLPTVLSQTPLLLETQRQMDAYFAGKLRVFNLPLKLRGTPFQMNVWKRLQQVPYGQAVTYGFMAREVGNPRAARAVGGAMHRNPISIIVPCHRVIGAGGALTGYGGGLSCKRSLLDLEQKYIVDAQG